LALDLVAPFTAPSDVADLSIKAVPDGDYKCNIADAEATSGACSNKSVCPVG
jgi:hypothetical protein